MRSNRVRSFAAAAILVLVALPLTAQRATRSVWVSALDGRGAPILNLTAEDFVLTENGVKREVTRASLGTAPLRIVLMVDSSTPVAPMISTFKSALMAFVDTLPEIEEVAFISSGGQIRVRARPNDSRDKLRAEVARFAPEGGANAFLDTLLEADKRFLRPVPAQWPAIVIVTTDRGENNYEPNVKDYNTFMLDFLARGGAAHAVILSGNKVGSVTDMVANLVDNVGGIRTTIVTDHSLQARLVEIADRLADDHQRMMRRYEVSYSGDAKLVQPTVVVSVNREDVEVQMSVRRPF